MVISGVLMVWIALEMTAWVPAIQKSIGGDYAIYMDAARRWLAGEGFYWPWQLAGPYELGPHEPPPVLYPPYAIPFLAVFSVLPWPAWYVPPITVTAWAIVRLRPGPWTRVILLALASEGFGWLLVVEGNPAIWVTAFLSLAALGYGTGSWAILKPSLFPLAAFMMWRRGWWLGLAAVTVLVALTAPLWPDYLTALGNARGPQATLLYSQHDLTLVLLPLVAWAGRQLRSAGIDDLASGHHRDAVADLRRWRPRGHEPLRESH